MFNFSIIPIALLQVTNRFNSPTMRVDIGHGSRLIVTLVDQYAVEEPSRVQVAVPVHENDRCKSLKNITFRELANAVNYAGT